MEERGNGNHNSIPRYSQKLVVPQYGGGDEKHDYGKGFYLTESIELAKEWAVADLIIQTDGSISTNLIPTDKNLRFPAAGCPGVACRTDEA
mgnify:CR=1 FL=1